MLAYVEDHSAYCDGDGEEGRDGIGAAVSGIRVYVRFLVRIVVIVMAHEVFSRETCAPLRRARAAILMIHLT